MQNSLGYLVANDASNRSTAQGANGATAAKDGAADGTDTGTNGSAFFLF
jgi:hypothetical protein